MLVQFVSSTAALYRGLAKSLSERQIVAWHGRGIGEAWHV
jgi:hypothetical protein